MSRAAGEDAPGVRRAWGWVDHLERGGTAPWREWSGEARPGGRALPGAQQLELLRRLNLAGTPSPELAARVLDASAPGRGPSDLPLEGTVGGDSFGPPPVDPELLPVDELVRVATGLLAEDVAAAGVPDPQPVRAPRALRRRYRLVGDPILSDPRRAELVARGRPPGGPGAVVLVLGTDVAAMLVHAWTARAFAEGAPPWPEWLGTVTRGRTLPPRVDLLRIARTWSARVGTERVQVVLDPALLPALTGCRRPLAEPAALSADAVELARRVSRVLGLLAVPVRRRALLRRTLRPRLEAAGGTPLVVPEAHADWLRERAAGQRDEILRAGYAVHGDPDNLLPVARAGTTEPSDAGVLALAVRLLLEGM